MGWKNRQRTLGWILHAKVQCHIPMVLDFHEVSEMELFKMPATLPSQKVGGPGFQFNKHLLNMPL